MEPLKALGVFDLFILLELLEILKLVKLLDIFVFVITRTAELARHLLFLLGVWINWE